jgi:NAD(P)-dependent dehydrogenase (short-subunit alcohol dehydrogenase family)
MRSEVADALRPGRFYNRPMKTILVTGATRGIGYATAKRLLARGQRVLALGRDFSTFDLAGERCTQVPFDLRAVDAIEAMCATLGRVDVLINNAAMLTAQPFESYAPKDRRDLIATNIEAPAELIRCLVPAMIARLPAAMAANSTNAFNARSEGSAEIGVEKIRGRVINIASVAGFGGHPDVWYGASKGAILNMTKSLAKRYGPQGIMVNAVAPGPTKTAMFAQLPQSRIDEFNRLVFAGRFAEADEIATVIEWLALDAPEYVNGSCVDAASGGYLR